MIKIDLPFIYVNTKNNSLVFQIKKYLTNDKGFNKNKKIITQFYSGEKLDKPFTEPTPTIDNHGSNNDYLNECLITSSFGNGNNLEPSILLKNPDNTIINRFFFKSAKLIKNHPIKVGPHVRNPSEILDITENDDVLDLELHTYYCVFKDSDVVSVSKRLINKSNKTVKISRLYSLEFPITSRDLEIHSFDGAWLEERQLHKTNLTSGSYKIQSVVGSSSHKHNPYFEIINKKNKQCFAFNLIYSGSHVETIEVNPVGDSKAMLGLNDIDFEYELGPNAKFITPEAILVFEKDMQEVRNEMHNFVNAHIIPPQFRNKPRPILLNTWEGLWMNIDEKSMRELAQVSKKVGIELLVMDDGWFKNRVNDHGGLGDWTPDKNKFPNSLKSFANNIKSEGVEFGIWFEPEMICINSDIYKKHPEFACRIPNRDPIERRHQIMIDMSNLNVVDYLFKCISKIIDETNISYIKWDYNRFMSDSYSSQDIKATEYSYRSMMGSYLLFEKLTSKYPNILFEGCASGGGRYDLGIFYYMPQTWGSDNSNSYDRTFISAGTFAGYPQSTFGAHVSRDGYKTPGINKTAHLEDRFNIQAVGCFGYEMDLRKYSPEDLEIIKKQIVFYKKYRKLFQFGHYVTCLDCFKDDRYQSFMLLNDKKDEGLFYICETKDKVPAISWKLKDLDENAKYEVTMREQANLKKNQLFSKILSGKELMEKGIFIGSLKDEIDASKYPGISNRLFHFKKYEK